MAPVLYPILYPCPLPSDFAVSSTEDVEYMSPTLDSELGHLACFGQRQDVRHNMTKICKALTPFSLPSCSFATGYAAPWRRLDTSEQNKPPYVGPA